MVRTALALSAVAIVALATGGLTASRAVPALISTPASPQPAPPTTFNIDESRSMVIYRVRDMGVSNFYGRVNAPTGSFTIDPIDPANSAVQIMFELKNMDTGDKNKDRLLLGPQYFNARQYPTAQFNSTSIKKINDSTYEATGAFTMRGVTKEITVTLADYAELQTTKFGYRGGFETTFTINRLDYGLNEHQDGLMLGLDVQITVSVQGLAQ